MSQPGPGVGPTNELSLRVSAATLGRVVFPHPDGGTMMLALEHKATVHPSDDGPQLTVKAQPFGGAVRLLRPDDLYLQLGGFNYDSRRSRREQDLRLFIRPESWKELITVCSQSTSADPPLIDVDPRRELEEEFEDSLGWELALDQVAVKPLRLLLQESPFPTANLRAPGQPTARIYWVHEITIEGEELQRALVKASQRQSPPALAQSALADASESGWGRANGVLLAPLDRIEAAYRALPPGARGDPLPFENTVLASNVAAVLPIDSPRFKAIDQAL